jgi:hypothetical protein
MLDREAFLLGLLTPAIVAAITAALPPTHPEH